MDAVFACLRAAPLSALARAQDAGGELCVQTPTRESRALGTDLHSFSLSSVYSQGSFYRKWAPVLDRKVIADYPTKLLAGGKFARVPIIVG